MRVVGKDMFSVTGSLISRACQILIVITRSTTQILHPPEQGAEIPDKGRSSQSPCTNIYGLSSSFQCIQKQNYLFFLLLVVKRPRLSAGHFFFLDLYNRAMRWVKVKTLLFISFLPPLSDSTNKSTRLFACILIHQCCDMDGIYYSDLQITQSTVKFLTELDSHDTCIA